LVLPLGEEADVVEAGVVNRAQDRLDLAVVQAVIGVQRDLCGRTRVVEHRHGREELLGVHAAGIGLRENSRRAREDDPDREGFGIVRPRLRIVGAGKQDLAMLDEEGVTAMKTAPSIREFRRELNLED
jgi:hypothetical protein